MGVVLSHTLDYLCRFPWRWGVVFRPEVRGGVYAYQAFSGILASCLSVRFTLRHLDVAIFQRTLVTDYNENQRLLLLEGWTVEERAQGLGVSCKSKMAHLRVLLIIVIGQALRDKAEYTVQ